MKPERHRQMIESHSANNVAATWLAIAVVVLIVPLLQGVVAWAFPALLILGLGTSGLCSLRALTTRRSSERHSLPGRGLLLHVGNLATVCGVFVAGVLQVLSQPR